MTKEREMEVIEGLYSKYLGRASDKAGLEYWTKVYADGAPLEQIENEFKICPERKIRDLYTSILKREPDVAGLHYWMGVLSAGTDYDDIKNEFMSCHEYKSLATH
jgi:endoglucanase